MKKTIENENEVNIDLVNTNPNTNSTNTNSTHLYSKELLTKLQDSYIRLLMVTPGMSETKARHLMSYYSCPKLLMEALRDPALSEQQRSTCLQYKFHATQRYMKLSVAVYESWGCE